MHVNTEALRTLSISDLQALQNRAEVRKAIISQEYFEAADEETDSEEEYLLAVADEDYLDYIYWDNIWYTCEEEINRRQVAIFGRPDPYAELHRINLN